jgi:Domain of unknown function (DUF6924)
MTITPVRSRFIRRHSGAKRSKGVMALLWAVLGLAFVGLFASRVISSRLAIGVGLPAGISLGIAWIIVLETNLQQARAIDMSQAMALDDVKRHRILRRAWLRIPFCLVVGIAFGYSAIAWGCPWLVNMGLGTRAEQVVVVTGWHSGSSRNCEQPEVDLAPFVASWNALCVSRSAMKVAPGAGLRLTGPATFLGMNVENIYVIDAKAQPPDTKHMAYSKRLPVTRQSLVLRTDFSDESSWQSICAAIQAPVGDFRAYVECVSDRAFEGVTSTDLPSLVPEGWEHSFVFLVDRVALSSPEHPILVVDLHEEPGRSFRIVPREAWGVENNLSIANMDFSEFAGSVDPDGVFRGFPR